MESGSQRYSRQMSAGRIAKKTAHPQFCECASELCLIKCELPLNPGSSRRFGKIFFYLWCFLDRYLNYIRIIILISFLLRLISGCSRNSRGSRFLCNLINQQRCRLLQMRFPQTHRRQILYALRGLCNNTRVPLPETWMSQHNNRH